MLKISTLTKRIAILTDAQIEEIRDAAGLSSEYKGTVFRPTEDNAMLLFKKDSKSKSEYTINLYSLRPTLNSTIQKPLPLNILDALAI